MDDLFESNFTRGSLASIFNSDQVDFICEALYLWRDGDRLIHLFRLDPSLFVCLNSGCSQSPAILRAYMFALYHSTIFRVMSENRFDSMYHPELTELWYEARYAEDQMRKHKKLGPVDKYRIRKKIPPPPSVWDGDELHRQWVDGPNPKLEDKNLNSESKRKKQHKEAAA
uniref:Homeobox protein SIX1 N-terminal SD domain-containing protein n=1 Tax=Ditylenchus dipsaci TaxID=166011 RepID=A0A915DU16_9BILA